MLRSGRGAGIHGAEDTAQKGWRGRQVTSVRMSPKQAECEADVRGWSLGQTRKRCLSQLPCLVQAT